MRKSSKAVYNNSPCGFATQLYTQQTKLPALHVIYQLLLLLTKN